ncbi:MAG TPA: rhodanese-like domain-containing protein, partial [bacterium]|nr:rhodanese-like domain-containing protein [bacterium]
DVPHVTPVDGQVIELGEAEVVALHTPGHTPDHFAYYVSDRHDADQAPALFSGDVMFVGDLGRPELLGGRMAEALAPQLYRTVWEKLAALPGHTILYPGHGAGSACGKNLSSKPTSTLAEEFATSPALQIRDEQAFVEFMTSDQPRVSPHFLEMVQTNRAGAPAPQSFEAIPELTADDIRTDLREGDTLVLDARSSDAYSRGHLPGTVYMGVNPGMPTWMGWLVNVGQPVVALVESRQQAEDLRRWMVRVGFDHLDGYHVFDPGAWEGELRTLATVPGDTFDPATVEGQFIDVRTPAEVARGTLPGARSIPLCELPGRMDELDKSRPLTVFCQAGYRGTIAGSLLENAGFDQVTNVAGGYAAVTKGREIACAASA